MYKRKKLFTLQVSWYCICTSLTLNIHISQFKNKTNPKRFFGNNSLLPGVVHKYYLIIDKLMRVTNHNIMIMMMLHVFEIILILFKKNALTLSSIFTRVKIFNIHVYFVKSKFNTIVYTAVQAVSAYFTSKQILPFGFAEQHSR